MDGIFGILPYLEQFIGHNYFFLLPANLPSFAVLQGKETYEWGTPEKNVTCFNSFRLSDAYMRQ